MITLGPIKYSITSGTVSMWNVEAEEGTPAFLIQSFHPHTGKAFNGYEEAEAWAIEYINTAYNLE